VRLLFSPRAVSSVIANVLLVAIVVILAATISVFALGFTEETTGSGPVVGQSSGELALQQGFSGGIVQISHIAGDPVAVSNIEIGVQAECDGGKKQGRIVNLPAEDGNDIDEDDDGRSQIEGDDIFSEKSLNTIADNVDIADGGALLDNEQYTAGETIVFRIPDVDCTLSPGAEITVRVAHTPTNSVVIKETLTAA
jgi:flagellin-like protein